MSCGKDSREPDALQIMWTLLCVCTLYALSVIGCAMLHEKPEVIKTPPNEYGLNASQ